MKFSHSQIKHWRRCQKSWSYKYVHNLTPKRKSDALYFGILFHEILEYVAKGHDLTDIYDDLWAKHSKNYFAEEIGDLFEKAFSNYEDYEYMWKDDPLEIIETEVHLEIELTNGNILHGYADGIVKDKNNRYWLLENKTGKRDADIESRYWDLQVVIYHSMIMQMMDIELSGTLWNWITSSEINDPRILQNGTLSRAVNQKTTWNRYLRVINEHGFDIDDYADLQPIFEARQNDFFSRSYLPYEEDIAKQLMLEITTSVEDIQSSLTQNRQYIRSMDRHCSWCDYQQLCRAEFSTSLENLEDIIEKEYQRRENTSN